MGNIAHSWTPGVTLESAERDIILKAFDYFKGNKPLTAQTLGIAIRTLDSKLEKYEADSKAAKESHRERIKERDEFVLRQKGQHPEQLERVRRGIEAERAAKEARESLDAEGGVRLESNANVSKKLDMPLSERQKVQGVSPNKTPSARPDRSR